MARLWLLWMMLVWALVGVMLLVAPLDAHSEAEGASNPLEVQLKNPAQLENPAHYPNLTVTVRITDRDGLNPQHLTDQHFTVIVGNEIVAERVTRPDAAARQPLNLVIALDSSFKENKDKQWEHLSQIGKLAEAVLHPSDVITFVIFAEDIRTGTNFSWDVPAIEDYTAFNQAISTSLGIAAQMQQANPGRAAVIVIANHLDNIHNSNLPPPPSLTEVLSVAKSRPKAQRAALYIYCYDLQDCGKSPNQVEELHQFVAKIGGEVAFLTETSKLQKSVFDRLNQLYLPADYDLHWTASGRVNQLYTVTIAVKYTITDNHQINTLEESGVTTKTFTPTAHPFTVTLDPLFADDAILTPASKITLTAAATQMRSSLASLQYTLNAQPSVSYGPSDGEYLDPVSLIELSQLPPGENKLTMVMTDSLGNPGRSTISWTVFHPFSYAVYPTSPVAVTQGAISTARYTLEIEGEPPITLIPTFILRRESGKPNQRIPLASISIPEAGEVELPFELAPYITQTAQAWINPAPACWPTPPMSVGDCLRHDPPLLWAKIVSATGWFTHTIASSPPITAPFCLAQAMDYGRCIVQKEQALWATLTHWPPQQPTQAHTLTLEIMDRIGRRSELLRLEVLFNYTRPTFWPRLQPHWVVLGVDLLLILLLGWLVWWLWRRYLVAHRAEYTLRLYNEGNVACVYHLWAMQTIQSPPTRTLLLRQPATLHFVFHVDGQTLSKADYPHKRMSLTAQASRPPKSADAASATPTLYDLHQPFQGAADTYELALGETPRFATQEVPPGGSLMVNISIRTRRRHWFRRTYSFEIYSEPASYGEEWRCNSGEERVRFGGFWAPVRITPATSPPPALPPVLPQRAARAAPSIGAG